MVHVSYMQEDIILHYRIQSWSDVAVALLDFIFFNSRPCKTTCWALLELTFSCVQWIILNNSDFWELTSGEISVDCDPSFHCILPDTRKLKYVCLCRNVLSKSYVINIVYDLGEDRRNSGYLHVLLHSLWDFGRDLSSQKDILDCGGWTECGTVH